MLSYRRPAGSATEKQFIARYLKPFKPVVRAQNYFIEVPGDTTTLFSCHTDTVHKDDGIQNILFDEAMGVAYGSGKDPLGADNTAGVWLLLEMIKAKIPGTYAFHFGEERGCLGSKAMAKLDPDFLRGFKRAIAFDRRGTTSIITHQMSERCCSDKFAQTLAGFLGSGYDLDDTGLFTDTASYIDLIPECTNVSVGYDHEHTPSELLDVEHCMLLRDLVCTVPWSELPTHRDPDAVPEYKSWMLGPDDDWATRYGKQLDNDRLYNEHCAVIEGLQFAGEWDYADVETLVREQPDTAADLLYSFLARESLE